MLALSFLAVTVPIETTYSWEDGLGDPYFLVKVIGWTLLAIGSSARSVRPASRLGLLTAGWAWLAANFWRAVADRLSRMAAGQSLELGTIELWFAGSSFALCGVGLLWCLWLSTRGEAANTDVERRAGRQVEL